MIEIKGSLRIYLFSPIKSIKRFKLANCYVYELFFLHLHSDKKEINREIVITVCRCNALILFINFETFQTQNGNKFLWCSLSDDLTLCKIPEDGEFLLTQKKGIQRKAGLLNQSWGNFWRNSHFESGNSSLIVI